MILPTAHRMVTEGDTRRTGRPQKVPTFCHDAAPACYHINYCSLLIEIWPNFGLTAGLKTPPIKGFTNNSPSINLQ